MEAPTIVGDRSVYHDCWWKRLPAAGKIRRSAAGGSVGRPSEGSVGALRRQFSCPGPAAAPAAAAAAAPASNSFHLA
eukprot:gene10553-biopygen1065